MLTLLFSFTLEVSVFRTFEISFGVLFFGFAYCNAKKKTERGSGVDQKFVFLNHCSDGRSETADAKISSKRGRFDIHMLDSEVGWITCE
jgi:hypothetical protein